MVQKRRLDHRRCHSYNRLLRDSMILADLGDCGAFFVPKNEIHDNLSTKFFPGGSPRRRGAWRLCTHGLLWSSSVSADLRSPRNKMKISWPSRGTAPPHRFEHLTSQDCTTHQDVLALPRNGAAGTPPPLTSGSCCMFPLDREHVVAHPCRPLPLLARVARAFKRVTAPFCLHTTISSPCTCC